MKVYNLIKTVYVNGIKVYNFFDFSETSKNCVVRWYRGHFFQGSTAVRKKLGGREEGNLGYLQDLSVSFLKIQRWVTEAAKFMPIRKDGQCEGLLPSAFGTRTLKCNWKCFLIQNSSQRPRDFISLSQCPLVFKFLLTTIAYTEFGQKLFCSLYWGSHTDCEHGDILDG
jgi:hypothetical protein